MADKDLQVVLSSGDLSGANFGGTASTDAVKTKGENDAIYQDLAGENAIVKAKYTPQGTPPTHVEGLVYYDSVEKVLTLQTEFGDVSLKIGSEHIIRVVNNSAGTIFNGKPVRHNGVSGGLPQIELAQADTFVNAVILGVATHDIIVGAEGYIVIAGIVHDIDTSSLTAGLPVYLSDTVAGGLTNTAPDIISQVGGTLTSDAVDGEIEVSIINNLNTPTVFGGMQGQTGTGIYALTATAQDVIGYATSNAVVVTLDLPNGTIELPNTGEYRMHFTSSISFTSLASTRTVYVELYDVTGAIIHFTYAKNIPRDATDDALSFSWPIAEIAGNVHKMRVRSDPDMSITFNDVSFDIQSVSIV